MMAQFLARMIWSWPAFAAASPGRSLRAPSNWAKAPSGLLWSSSARANPIRMSYSASSRPASVGLDLRSSSSCASAEAWLPASNVSRTWASRWFGVSVACGAGVGVIAWVVGVIAWVVGVMPAGVAVMTSGVCVIAWGVAVAGVTAGFAATAGAVVGVTPRIGSRTAWRSGEMNVTAAASTTSTAAIPSTSPRGDFVFGAGCGARRGRAARDGRREDGLGVADGDGLVAALDRGRRHLRQRPHARRRQGGGRHRPGRPSGARQRGLAAARASADRSRGG